MDLAGKKITVMGLGLLGRGVGDATWLAEAGAELIVTDLKSRGELAESVAALEGYDNVRFVLGEHRREDFVDRDLIIKGPSVPRDSPYIAQAKREGIPVRMSADLLVEAARQRYPGVVTIGVTGTRGKSTVAHLVAQMLAAAGRPFVLGGNIRGAANLPLIDELSADTLLLLELDSWQLQGFGEAAMSPEIAVFTTFFDDHLNYYHGDRSAYLADKANIFLHQREEDYLVIGYQAIDRVRDAYGRTIRSRVEIAGEKTVPPDWSLNVPGDHNRYNAGVAVCAARLLGLEDQYIKKGVESFTGVPGRLELVYEKHGIRYFNDTTATTPEATLAALRALTPSSEKMQDIGPPSIVLIAGGADKGLGAGELVEAIPQHCKALVLLPGSGTDSIREQVTGVRMQDVASMREAVEAARALAEEGDVVLLSPAFASFGLFKNEFDRGDQFSACVQQAT